MSMSTPNVSELKRILDDKPQAAQQPQQTMLELWEVYIHHKFELSKDIRKTSVRTYNILRSLLIDYRKKTKRDIRFEDVDERWLLGLVNFMSEEHDPNVYRTTGGLSQGTTYKRWGGFKSFYNHCYKRGMCERNRAIEVFQVKSKTPDIVALNEEQLEAFKKYQPRTEHYQKVKDIFLVLCYTAMRYSDYDELNPKKHIIRSETIVKKSKKTSMVFQVPLHNVVKDILLRYQMLPKMTSQVFNRSLRELCRDVPGFNQEVHFNEFKGNQNITMPLWKAMSSHVGRHTAATRWIMNKVPHNVVMQWAGWKTTTMLFHYLKKSGMETASYMDEIS